MSKKRYRFVLTALILLIRIYVGLIILVPSLFVESLMSEFNVSQWMIGLFIGSIMIAAAAIALFTGPIVSRIGVKRGGFLSIIIIALTGYAIGFTPNFTAALVTRLLMGFGVILAVPIFTPIVKTWYAEKEYGRVNAIVESSTSIGIALNFALTPILFPPPFWREAYLVYSSLAFTLAILWGFLGRGPLGKPDRESGKYFQMLRTRIPRLFRIKEVVLMAGVLFISMGVTTGIISWIPDYLTMERGYGIALAAFVVVFYNLANIFSWPIGGFLSDRIGLRRPFLIVGGILSFVTSLATITLVGVIPAVAVFLFIGLFGIFNALYSFSTVTILMEHPEIDHKTVPYAYSIVLFFAFSGAAIMPTIIGFVGDLTGLIFYGLIISTFLYTLVSVFGLFLRETGWKKAVEHHS